jgi:hypothetical protein
MPRRLSLRSFEITADMDALIATKKLELNFCYPLRPGDRFYVQTAWCGVGRSVSGGARMAGKPGLKCVQARQGLRILLTGAIPDATTA